MNNIECSILYFLFKIREALYNMSKRKCIVPNCLGKDEKTFHTFPANKDLGRKWITAIDSPVLKNLSYEDIRKKQLKVCKKHFNDNAYMGGISKPNLKFDAVPTVDVSNPNLIEKDVIIDNQENIESLCIDLNAQFTMSSFSSGLSYSSVHNDDNELRQSSLNSSFGFFENSNIDNEYEFMSNNNPPLHEMNINENQEIPQSPKSRRTTSLKPRQLSFRKLYKVELSPVVKKMHQITKAAKKRYFDTAYRLKRYN